jgi:hypothetical protein
MMMDAAKKVTLKGDSGAEVTIDLTGETFSPEEEAAFDRLVEGGRDVADRADVELLKNRKALVQGHDIDTALIATFDLRVVRIN